MKKTGSMLKSRENYLKPYCPPDKCPAGAGLIIHRFTVLRTVLLLCSLLLLSACQQPVKLQQATLSDAFVQKSRIVVMKNNRQITPAELADRLRQAPLLIVGEEHTRAEHHIIEQWLLERLTQLRPQGSVLLEMFSTGQQPLINEVKRAMAGGGYLREPRIRELLDWHDGWPWPLYRGLVLTALKGGYPLLAANLDPAQVSMIFRSGQLPAGEKSASNTVRDFLASSIAAVHGGGMSAGQLSGMLAVQQNRDRLMAQQLLQAPRPALLIAGGFHAAKDTGVPLHMQDLRGGTPAVLILAAEGDTLTAAQADYVWYTPAHEP